MNDAPRTTDGRDADGRDADGRLEREAERERKARQEAESIAERSLRHLYAQKERLALLQALAAAANAASTSEEAKREALALVCKHTGWPVGHVYRRRGERRVPTGIWCGEGDERYARWRAVTEATSFARGEGLPGRVLATGRPAWIRDVAEEEDFLRAEAAAEVGLHGAMAFPVLVGDEVAAVLEFYSDQPEEPDEALLELMAYAGVQVGYVVERQRIEHRHALILGGAGDGIFGVDAEGRTTFVNEAAAELLGWAREALLGQPSHEAFHHHRADGSPYPYEECPLYAVLRDGREQRVTGEVFWRRDGTSFPVAYVATPLREGDEITGAVVVFHDESEREELRLLQEAERALREEARTLETINRVNATLAAELDREKLVQAVTDAGTELTGAAFGAFFYNVLDERGEAYTLYTLSGAPRAAFERYPMPRNTAIFHPTFSGEGVVRLDDVTADPRFGQNAPFFGMPEGHLPVRSYLAVPVRSPAGEVIGGLFFGHGEAGVFTERAERLAVALADQAAIALQNADLYARVRESERQLLTLIDHLPELAWSARPDGHIDFYNRRWYAYTGTTFEEMEGWGWERVHDPALLPRVVERWRHSIETGEPFEMEFPLRGADGGFRWFLTRITPLRDAEGRITRWIGTNADIDEQRGLLAERDEALAGLARSEAQLRQMAEGMPQIVWTTRPDGYHEYFNERWYEYTGMPRPDDPDGERAVPQGWNWKAYLHPDDYDRSVARWQRSLDTGEPYEIEYRFKRGSDGAYRWFLGRAVPLYDEGGAVVRWFGTCTDIDEQKQTAAALEEARRDLAEVNQTLEERVAARTRELSEALRALGDKEALLHSVTANALDGIAALEAVHDEAGAVVDFRWLLVNPPAEAMYGRSRTELVGALQSEVLPDVKPMGLHDALARVVETGEPFRQEVQAPDDPARWYSLSVAKLGDGVVALFRDISESKAAEAALRTSEHRLREAQKLAHVGSWRWEVAADRVTWSDELYRIFGYEPGHIEVDYERYTACLHPDDREAVGRTVQEAVAKGEGYELNHRIVRPDGAVRWIHSYGEVVPDEAGAVAAIQGTAQDVTERVEAERALQRYAAELEQAQAGLRASADFLQSTLDSLTAHVAILDEHGTVLAVNEAWRRFARNNEYDGGDCGLGTSYLEACDAADGEAVAADVAAGIRRLLDGEVEQFTAEYPCHSPTEQRWFLLRVTRFDGPEGIRLVTAHENVTEMKRAQAELQRFAAELQESNEELQKFAYVASHDLQEPLRMVTSFLQLLERRYADGLDDTAREYIGYAVDGARRMQRLIQDLLAYSRIGTRGQDFAEVDAGEVVLDVLHDLGPAVHEAGAAVEAEGLPVVLADKTQLHQLFLNLVGNALKFRRADETPRIRIAAEPAYLDDGRPAWRFAVSDNGIGIDPQYGERIFQVFQRLHTRDEYEGTGIGLAICRKIVERHGGTIALASAPGEGATFTFTLPAPTTAPPRTASTTP